MDRTEIVITPTGVLRRKVSETAVTEDVAELCFQQLTRDTHVFTPNLIDTGSNEFFDALHGISLYEGETWFAAKLRKLKFNGRWMAQEEALFPNDGGEVRITDASELTVDVPVPLFIFVNPYQRRLYMLGPISFVENGARKPLWGKYPFPNTYCDGKLCTGELPFYDGRLSVTTNAIRMLAAWTDNEWNGDLYNDNTVAFLKTVASFTLPEGTPQPAASHVWSEYAYPANPGITAINLAGEHLFEMYYDPAIEEEQEEPHENG